MKITIAKNSGFCFGVKRAIEKALKAKGKAYSLGPLIHNSQVIKELEKKGIKVVNSVKKIKKGTVIIRTHGVPDKVIEHAKRKRLKIVDATCPFVKIVHGYAKKLYSEGYKVIVVGEKKHPEVLGIIGNIKNAIAIENPKQAEKVKNKKIAVVSQTTQSKSNFEKIIKKLKKQNKEVKAFNTICNATKERQIAAKELAKKSDLMIVVGGRNSGNTKRLAEVCSKLTETKKIETAKEIKKKWLKGKRVGITAGASTPEKMIKEVICRIKCLLKKS